MSDVNKFLFMIIGVPSILLVLGILISIFVNVGLPKWIYKIKNKIKKYFKKGVN